MPVLNPSFDWPAEALVHPMEPTEHELRDYRTAGVHFFCSVCRLWLAWPAPFDAAHCHHRFLAARTITLGVAVILFGGVPGFAMAALVVFVILGVMQSGDQLADFYRLAKDRHVAQPAAAQQLPLWSAVIAICLMHEKRARGSAGTVLVVAGVVMISWKPKRRCRATAGGMCFIRRCRISRRRGVSFAALRLDDHQRAGVFQLRCGRIVSLLGVIPYTSYGISSEQELVWHRRAGI